MVVEPPPAPTVAPHRQSETLLVTTQTIFHEFTFCHVVLVRTITTCETFGLSMFTIAGIHRLWSLVDLAV
jgi:hypothetical protein